MFGCLRNLSPEVELFQFPGSDSIKLPSNAGKEHSAPVGCLNYMHERFLDLLLLPMRDHGLIGA